MNSVLQVLCHTPEIVKYFLDGDYEDTKKNYSLKCAASDQLKEVIHNIWNGKKKVYRPNDFKNNVKYEIEFLRDTNQHDSSEFLARLLNLIDDELTGKKKIEKLRQTRSNTGYGISSDYSWPKVKPPVTSIISRMIEGNKDRVMKCDGENCRDCDQQTDSFISLPVNISSNDEITVNIIHYPFNLSKEELITRYTNNLTE